MQSGAGSWPTARPRPCIPSHGTTRERQYRSLLISLAQKQALAWDAGTAADAVAQAGADAGSDNGSGTSSHQHHAHPPLALKEERRRDPPPHPPPTSEAVVQARAVQEGSRCALTSDAEEISDDPVHVGGGVRPGMERGDETAGRHRLSATGDDALGLRRDAAADDGAAGAGAGAGADVADAADAATGATATYLPAAVAGAAGNGVAAASADRGEVLDEAEAERRAAARRVVRARRQRDRRRKERATLAAKKALVRKVCTGTCACAGMNSYESRTVD